MYYLFNEAGELVDSSESMFGDRWLESRAIDLETSLYVIAGERVKSVEFVDPPLSPSLDDICMTFPDCRVLQNQGRFYLGDIGDMSVGIHPYELTPSFLTEALLESYARSARGRLCICRRAAEIFPEFDAATGMWTE